MIKDLISTKLSFYIKVDNLYCIHKELLQALSNKKYYVDFNSKLIQSNSSKEGAQIIISNKNVSNTSCQYIHIIKNISETVFDLGYENNKIVFKNEYLENLSDNYKFKLRNRINNIGNGNKTSINIRRHLEESLNLKDLIKQNKKGLISINVNNNKDYYRYLDENIPNNLSILTLDKTLKNRLYKKSFVVNPEKVLSNGLDRTVVLVSTNNEYIPYSGVEPYSICLNGSNADYKIEVKE